MDKSVLDYLTSLGLEPSRFKVANRTGSNIKLIEMKTKKVLDIRF